MNTALDIVNQSFEKLASQATGRDASRVYERNKQRKAQQQAKNMAKNNAAKQGPAPMASAGDMSNKAKELKSGAAKSLKNHKMKGVATKAAVGAGVAATAIGAGVAAKKVMDKKKEEKTAFDIVNEAFDKQASLATAIKGAGSKVVGAVKNTGLGSAVDDYVTTSRNLGKMKGLAVDGAKAGNKSYTQIAGDGINHLEGRQRIAGKQVKHELGKVPGHAANFAKNNKGLVAAGATAAGTGIAASQIGKKKEEKTAFEIVNETFEKLC